MESTNSALVDCTPPFEVLRNAAVVDVDALALAAAIAPAAAGAVAGGGGGGGCR